MNPFLFLILLAAAAYLVGSVPFGYLVARWHGIDLLRVGSGNIGATNVARALGRRWGVVIFLLDLAKGALPVLLALRWAAAAEIPSQAAAVAAGVAAFLGHLFPIYLGFRGGKGVATGAGVVLVLLPGPTALALAVWGLVVVSSRYVSLASLTAAAVLLGVRLAQGSEVWKWPYNLVTAFCVVAVGLVFVRHRTNIVRLLHGKENRLRDTPGMFVIGKALHVLALGLWFGTAVFFTFVVGLSLFRTFERLSVEPRPYWLPVPAELAGPPPSPAFPDPLRKEQGSRLAGAAVGPLFDKYYPLQIGCAVIAAVTALGWCLDRREEKLPRVRAGILIIALATLALGWWLANVVSELRLKRNEASDAVLLAARPEPSAIVEAEQVRAAFGHWHFASLLANFATVVLVMGATALTAQLPAERPDTPVLLDKPAA